MEIECQNTNQCRDEATCSFLSPWIEQLGVSDGLSETPKRRICHRACVMRACRIKSRNILRLARELPHYFRHGMVAKVRVGTVWPGVAW